MSRAAAFAEFGPPQVLRLIDVEAPQAGPGEVRIRARAAGVQPADTVLRSGRYTFGLTVTFPQVPGNEVAGVVDQVGEGVTGFAPGDEVIGFRGLGCYADLVVVEAAQVAAKPAGMPWEAAGGFSASAQTAHVALQALRVGKDDTVIVHGAAGAVGTIAVQLARAWGATVVGTASERNHDYLRSLGAVPVTYGDGLVERVRSVAPQGVDAALDAAGRGALQASVELVTDRDRIGTIVDYAAVAELGVQAIRGPRTAARLGELLDLWSDGTLRVEVSRTFPLAEAAEAHRLVESGHGRGKVVLTIG